MCTWCKVRNFASQKFRLTPATLKYSTSYVPDQKSVVEKDLKFTDCTEEGYWLYSWHQQKPCDCRWQVGWFATYVSCVLILLNFHFRSWLKHVAYNIRKVGQRSQKCLVITHPSVGVSWYAQEMAYWRETHNETMD